MTVKQRMLTFLSSSENFGNYSDTVKSIANMFTYVYQQPCVNGLYLMTKGDKFELLEFYDQNVDKIFKKDTCCYFRKFFAMFKDIAKDANLDFTHFSVLNQNTYILTTRGIIEIDYDPKTGIIDDIVIMPTDAEDAEEVEFFKKIIVSSLVLEPSTVMKKNHYKIAYIEDGMITTMTNEFDDWTTNIEKNYNDDVPYKEIIDEMRTDKASLILLYGKPGTGKSSLIKSIVNDNLDKEFIYVDSSLFTSLSNGQFLSFLTDHKGSIFILEDCEKAIKDRRDSNNEAINTILNITDGLVAESLKCKFICTFNCPISTIDEALLRKGRLDVLYEFTNLTLGKTKVIYPDAIEEMTVADAYHATVKNKFGGKQTKKVGF